jgi:ParB/RepB/Spo0J family partition protein
MAISVAGQYQNARIVRADILVDNDLNSRKGDNTKTVERLRDSIKAQGVIHPALVVRTSQLGPAYKTATQNYVLIAGFRRQAALDLIDPEFDRQENDYRIAPADWTLTEALVANLSENLGREDLSTFELASQCLRLRDDHNLSAKEIAGRIRSLDCESGERKPLSEAHINNMIRCVAKLHNEILRAWQDQHPKARLRTLIQLAAEDDQDAQLKLWRGVENPEAAAAENDDDATDKPEKPVTKRRPTPTQITIKIDQAKALVKDGKKSADWGKGVIDALRWSAGLADRIPGIKDPEPEESDDAI